MKRTWKRAAALGVLTAAVLVGWAGGEDAASDKLPADLAHIPTKAVGLLSVRVADLWTSDAAKLVREKMAKGSAEKMVEGMLEANPAKIDRLTLVWREVGPRSEDIPLIFFALTEKFDAKEVFGRLVHDGKEMKAAEKSYTANEKRAAAALSDRAFVVGSPADVRGVLSETQDRTSGLASTVRLLAGKHLATAGVNPAALPPLPEKLPPELEPFTPLLKARIATATLDLGKSGSLSLRATFPDAEAATAAAKAVEEARKLGLGFLDQGIKQLSKGEGPAAMVDLVKELRAGLKEGGVKREAGVLLAEVRFKIDREVVLGALMGAAIRVQEAAARAQTQNNLKQIGIAVLNYAGTYNGKFPAQAIYNKQGKPLLSWRVTILPFIDQQKLYEEFKLDEPWDSPHNKKLLAKMPKTYERPGAAAPPPGHTYFQGFAGKGTIFDGKQSANLNNTFAFKGTSNTLMIVEAGKAVPWTKPEDIPFDPAKKLPKLGTGSRGGALVVLCDGSIRVLSDAIQEKTLKWAISVTTVEVPPKDW